jgi:hypothetical protein
MNSKDRLIRNIAGAIAASLVVSTVFTLFGYSGGATTSDFFKELAVAFTSYVSVALLISYWTRLRDRLLYDVGCISLLGSGVSYLLKLIVLAGRNGIPAYVAKSARELSWKPYFDLFTDALMSTAFATLISLPFIAVGAWLWTIRTKKHS